MCIEYRALNSPTIKNRYALPRIDEFFDRLHGAKVFSNIDLTSGYWQMAIAAADRLNNAFSYTLWRLRIQRYAVWINE